MPTKPTQPILPPIQEGTPTVYRALKNNKAAGRDGVLVEQLKHIGQKANAHRMLHRKQDPQYM